MLFMSASLWTLMRKLAKKTHMRTNPIPKAHSAAVGLLGNHNFKLPVQASAGIVQGGLSEPEVHQNIVDI